MPPHAIDFVPLEAPREGAAVLLVGAERALGAGRDLVDPDGSLDAVFDAAEFDGSASSTVWAYAAPGASVERVLAMGIGAAKEFDENDWRKLGGAMLGKLGTKGGVVTVMLDVEGATPDSAAALAQGAMLRSYRYDRFKTKSREDDDASSPEFDIRIAVDDPDAARAAFTAEKAVAEGVATARDLVNDPPNALGTEEFRDRAKALEEHGLTVTVLDEAAMRERGMGALLCVAQGSPRPPFLVVMEWKGGAEGEAPLAFVGKGVVFDSGGISIKPGQGMGDMKGDMAGAAAVTGLMHALAARKAKANVVGIIGLVENMPDGNATRPGDIVTSMSGQTIEVLNTDAEGRLVLADALTYAREDHAPRLMVNLATLTGAILVALGQERAGMFSNDDPLAEALFAAGEATQEKLWRMPLGKAYDKLIDTKNADMKNIGGRFAGSITAAQFLQRFVADVPWAHLDIAGTAMNSPASEYSQSWASGFGVRLLDRFVRDNHEG